MAEHRERIQRARNRRQSVRVAARAISQSVSETTPSQQKQLKQGGFKPRPRLSTSDPAPARATNPITFGVGKQGRIRTTNIVGAARHEVAHHLGAGHLAIRATGASETAVGLRQAPSAQRISPGRQLAMISQRRERRSRVRIPTTTRPSSSTQGFQTPQLQKVETTGTSSQQSRSREQMRRLGRRLRGRIDF